MLKLASIPTVIRRKSSIIIIFLDIFRKNNQVVNNLDQSIKYVVQKNKKRKFNYLDTYKPNPKYIDSIIVPDEIIAYGEAIAKNIHERWSLERIREGWTYGEQYNYEEKKHPCLIPYELLSESEKDYDRNTSMATIKTLLSIGFEINKKTDSQHFDESTKFQTGQER